MYSYNYVVDSFTIYQDKQLGRKSHRKQSPERLNADVERFMANGGKIQLIPTGLSGKDLQGRKK